MNLPNKLTLTRLILIPFFIAVPPSNFDCGHCGTCYTAIPPAAIHIPHNARICVFFHNLLFLFGGQHIVYHLEIAVWVFECKTVVFLRKYRDKSIFENSVSAKGNKKSVAVEGYRHLCYFVVSTKLCRAARTRR